MQLIFFSPKDISFFHSQKKTMSKFQFLYHHCIDCVPGFYGERCEYNCGKCNNETTCNTASGVCPNDCQENWIPPFCAGNRIHK